MLILQLSPAKLLSLSVAAGKLPTHTNTTRRTAAAYFTHIYDCEQMGTCVHSFASQAASSYQFVCMIGVFAVISGILLFGYQRHYHSGAYLLGYPDS